MARLQLLIGVNTIRNAENIQFIYSGATPGVARSPDVSPVNLVAASFKISIAGGSEVDVALPDRKHTISGGFATAAFGLAVFANDLVAAINTALATDGQSGRILVAVNSPLAFNSSYTGSISSVSFSSLSIRMQTAIGAQNSNGEGLLLVNGMASGTSTLASTILNASAFAPSWPGSGSTGMTANGGAAFSNKYLLANSKMPALQASRVSVANLKNALISIYQIDLALSNVSKGWVKLGALQNRLKYVILNAQNKSLNLQMAKSRISDTDIALEIIKLAKQQVLQIADIKVIKEMQKSKANIMKLI